MNVSRISATLLLVSFLPSASVLAGAQRFIRPAVYSAGNPTFGVVTGDFNADGNADLAFVSNTNPAVVTLRLGIGNGRFNKGQQITLTDTSGGILAGDWNNDGVLDLAVSQRTSQSISILLGVGDGTFTVVGSFNAGGIPGLLATGDLNGDGVPDLVSALGGSNLSVLLGLGRGSSVPPKFSAPEYSPALTRSRLPTSISTAKLILASSAPTPSIAPAAWSGSLATAMAPSRSRSTTTKTLTPSAT